MPSRSNRVIEQVMGLPVSVDLRGDDADDETIMAAVRSGLGWLHEVDARFSPFRSDSEACRFDRGELGPAQLSADLVEVLELSTQFEIRTGGAFRARVGGRGLDLCGIVKGWAVQRLADRLRAAGATNFCLNAGGDIVTAGEPEPGRRWRVGIRHPLMADRMCATLTVGSTAVATSGSYERGPHIVDGRTGLTANGLLSMTIVAPNLTIADATATAAFALGRVGAVWAEQQPDCLVFAVTDDGRVHRSPGLDDLLVPA
ncbi:MAG TPA: FAD:protein FMN transferase [Pseudonocardiaceae bacterium]